MEALFCAPRTKTVPPLLESNQSLPGPAHHREPVRQGSLSPSFSLSLFLSVSFPLSVSRSLSLSNQAVLWTSRAGPQDIASF